MLSDDQKVVRQIATRARFMQKLMIGSSHRETFMAFWINGNIWEDFDEKNIHFSFQQIANVYKNLKKMDWYFMETIRWMATIFKLEVKLY